MVVVAGASDINSQIASTVRQLLGIGSFTSLVRSLIERSCLPQGAFESHEFGKGEHSTASGAAVLVGLSGIGAIPDDLIAPIAEAISCLATEDGGVLGHDRSRQGPDTSWRSAQVLLGLLTRPSLSEFARPKIAALLAQLESSHDPLSGGWALRRGEDARLLFAFYPAIALARAWRLGLLADHDGTEQLGRVTSYLSTQLRSEAGTLEERVLAARALQVIGSAWEPLGQAVPDLGELRAAVLRSAWTTDQGLILTDRLVGVHRQPIWHAIIWRPLLYLAVRGPSPASPLQSMLGHELLSSFDHDIAAWKGPPAAHSSSRSPSQGVSWASALALRATYALAQDLLRFGLTAQEWLDRSRGLASAQFDFDVAISYAGSNRDIAARISDELKLAGYRVFYDRDYQHALLGEDLTQYLQDTYFRRSRFAIVIISSAFKESNWASNWEWKAVLARMHDQRGAYLLPYVLEDTDLPGLTKTIGYVSHRDCTPTEFAALVIRKLREAR
jgi:hypothetical protein